MDVTPEGVAAAIASAGFVWAALVRPILTVRDELRDQRDDIADIKAELKPNGGGSFRDVANRTESGLNEVKQRLDEHINFHLQEGRKQ